MPIDWLAYFFGVGAVIVAPIAGWQAGFHDRKKIGAVLAVTSLASYGAFLYLMMTH